MKIVFIGASKFGFTCLQRILNFDYCQIVGAVTAPQTFSTSYRPEGVTNVLYKDISGYCRSNDIDCIVINQGIKDATLFERVKAWKPDIFLVVGWYHIIPQRWLNLAPAFGLHASMLPDYSGCAPLVWAIINGEKETGISLFQLSNGVDNGPIVGQLAIEIKHNDTIATLYQRIEELGLKLLEENLPKIADGSHQFTKQDESKRRLFPPRSPEDGLIDWTLPAPKVYDFIRAQTKPYPGAFSFFRGSHFKIWEGCLDLNNTINLKPGEIARQEDCVYVGCGDKSSLLLVLVGNDGQESNALVWFINNKIKNGESFTSSY